jgi:hypothetical protein
MELEIPKNKRKYIKWIKDRYPVGRFVYDDSRSEAFYVRKNSVFEVFLDDPADGVHEWVTFTVRRPGKDSDRIIIDCILIKWIDL